MTPQRSARLAMLAAVLATLLVGCAGQRLHSDGMRLAAEGKHDAALPLLQQAQRQDPTNSGYLIDLLRETSSYADELLRRGDEARTKGDVAEAAGHYRKALAIEPANERARRGLAGLESDARAGKLVADSERLLRDGQLDAARDKINAALMENPRSADAKRQLALVTLQSEQQREAKAAQAAARSIMNRPVTLQFRDANLRMVFEALSRTTGLNVILDRDVRADLKTTIFVKDAALEDTVNLILLQNQLEKRALNANTMFVYPAHRGQAEGIPGSAGADLPGRECRRQVPADRAEDRPQGQGSLGRRAQQHAGDPRHARSDRGRRRS